MASFLFVAWRDPVGCDKARQPGLGPVGYGMGGTVCHGPVRQGVAAGAWNVEARRDLVGLGKAVMAGRGTARRGRVGRVMAGRSGQDVTGRGRSVPGEVGLGMAVVDW